jgi:hypothetical protein
MRRPLSLISLAVNDHSDDAPSIIFPPTLSELVFKARLTKLFFVTYGRRDRMQPETEEKTDTLL